MGITKTLFVMFEIEEEAEQGFVLAIGPCFACGEIIKFNPVKVPSYNGQPLCLPCVVVANEIRKVKGLDEWPISHDAYQPCHERELLTLKSRNDEN